MPLTDAQKYKAKAFIDVVIDRAGKALSSVALLLLIALQGVSIASCLLLALVALLAWVFASNALGRAYASFTAARRNGASSRGASSAAPADTRAALPSSASPRA